MVPAEDDSSQRSLQISSRAVSTKTHQSPKKVVDAAYYVQAAMELGYYLFDWSLVENVLTGDDLARFNEDLVEIKKWNSNTTYNDDYNVTFDGGALMKGFLHFLENNASNDKCKMVFIYGENDPWTGAAIPDDAADDTYIKKFVIPQGIHNSELNNETYYPKDYRQKIIEAIEGFLY